ncbi:MAG: hypothetical protein ABI608_00175 [Rhizomicrobium sp.]
MAEDNKIEGIVTEQKTRRSAIKTAAQVAVTAPAVGLLLSASTKAAGAQVLTYANNFTGDDTYASDAVTGVDSFSLGGTADDLVGKQDDTGMTPTGT